VTNDRGDLVEPDPLKMKVFEIEHLGQFDEDDYEGTSPDGSVAGFRRDRVVTALNRHAWHHRDEDFSIEEVNLLDVPVLRDVLESHDWEDVARVYEDLEPGQWDDPPANTETAAIKERTIGNMIELFDYSPASAELTSRHVMGQVSYRWD
jgi:predicted Ser/Thr protein kinase